MAEGFASTLRRLRERRGISQSALTHALGCNHGHVSRMESGDRLPSLPMLARLSVLLTLDNLEYVQFIHAAVVAAAEREQQTIADAERAADEAGRRARAEVGRAMAREEGHQ